MLLAKQGFPEENELVLCIVTKIHFHSVFVNLDEYNKSGMIHISEISPGRIRNIRDYVVEGKVIVCKVLRIDTAKGHIDLSLRRVSDNQRRNKVNEIKQEQKSEKIVEFVAKQLNLDFKKLYAEISPPIFKNYPLLSLCFEDVALQDYDLAKLGIDAKIASALTEVIKLRIKPPEVEIKSKFILKTYAPNGVDNIKEALKKCMEKANESTFVAYAGGGKFDVVVKAQDYKECEKVFEKMSAACQKYMEKNSGMFTFQRSE